MVNKIRDVQWKAVSLEGFPVSNAENFNGFVGLEECFDYDLDSFSKNDTEKKKKRENDSKLDKKSNPVPNKKIKYNNGFIVEECRYARPSRTVCIKDPDTERKIVKKKNKPGKRRAGLPIDESTKLSLDDLMAWSEFQIPEEILRALGDQGFAKPTRIQELALPAALLGRRDILGAAETGSGKTLAFGIPIIAGIMQLKAKQQAGQDVYDIKYKKSSFKKKATEPDVSESNKSKRIIKNKAQSKKVENGINKRNSNNFLESNSDDSTGGSDDDSRRDDEDEGLSDNENEADEQDASGNSDVGDSDNESGSDNNNEDVSVNTEEGQDNDSDSSDDYVHLSELHDSDDFKDSSDEEDAKDGSRVTDDDESTQSADEMGHEEGGMGCVKVIDDIEMPEKVVVKTGKPLYALVLTPTRELAMQVTQHLVAATKYTGIRVAVVVGGLAQVKQERILAHGPEIVVATPGRLWELVQQGVPHLEQIDHIKFLAIDEADRMVERSHFEELHELLERVNADESQRSARQNFVFSATLTMVHELPAHMKGKKVTKRGKILNRKIEKMTPEQKVKKLIALVGMTEPKVVDITDKNKGTAETLTECRIACPIDSKDYYLFYILQRHPGRTIIFCNSIGCVKRLAQLLGLLKCSPLPLHASMQQRQRLKNLERFRDDPHGVLVATDVAARGLDIPNVDHVIHYQVPRTAENYVHRSGRTARANKEGLTILMMEPGEAFNYLKLCKTLGKSEDLPSFPVPDQLLLSTKQLVNAARELDRMELAARKANLETGWLKKVADEMDIIVDEDFLPIKASKNGVSTQALNIKRKQLEALLGKPFFPKGFSFKYPTLNAGMNFQIAGDQKNALEVMKDALETGSLKKQKRKSKNATLLNLEKQLTTGLKSAGEKQASKKSKNKNADGGKKKNADGGNKKNADGGNKKNADGGKNKNVDSGKNKNVDNGKKKNVDSGKKKNAAGGKKKNADGTSQE